MGKKKASGAKFTPYSEIAHKSRRRNITDTMSEKEIRDYIIAKL